MTGPSSVLRPPDRNPDDDLRREQQAAQIGRDQPRHGDIERPSQAGDRSRQDEGAEQARRCVVAERFGADLVVLDRRQHDAHGFD